MPKVFDNDSYEGGKDLGKSNEGKIEWDDSKLVLKILKMGKCRQLGMQKQSTEPFMEETS